MTRFTLIFLSLIMVFGFSQENEMTEIETYDGNIFLGEVVERDFRGLSFKNARWHRNLVPSESIKSVNSIKTITSKKVISGELILIKACICLLLRPIQLTKINPIAEIFV